MIDDDDFPTEVVFYEFQPGDELVGRYPLLELLRKRRVVRARPRRRLIVTDTPCVHIEPGPQSFVPHVMVLPFDEPTFEITDVRVG